MKQKFINCKTGFNEKPQSILSSHSGSNDNVVACLTISTGKHYLNTQNRLNLEKIEVNAASPFFYQCYYINGGTLCDSEG